MVISLGERSVETVKTYFIKAQNPEIKSRIPQKAKSIEEAIADYEKSRLPGARSFGRIIRADGRHVGDIWCTCISAANEPNAMLSCCVFDQTCWNRGIATEAVKLFIREISGLYPIKTIGAFSFADNTASIRVLEKSGFELAERFTEDGKESVYYLYQTA